MQGTFKFSYFHACKRIWNLYFFFGMSDVSWRGPVVLFFYGFYMSSIFVLITHNLILKLIIIIYIHTRCFQVCSITLSITKLKDFASQSCLNWQTFFQLTAAFEWSMEVSVYSSRGHRMYALTRYQGCALIICQLTRMKVKSKVFFSFSLISEFLLTESWPAPFFVLFDRCCVLNVCVNYT